MKIFLSALEGTQSSKSEGSVPISKLLVKKGIKMKYNLMSYYYIQSKKNGIAEFIRDNSKEILIDSGAHSFQKGKKVDWENYTRKYADFIKKFDKPNVLGYFEMDVDNVIGYEKVIELRQILENVTDKIIPVWHKNRGIEEYKKMCQKYSGKIIAITGFKNEDIKDEQYLMFLKYAKKHGCKVHCLGMTRRKVLDKVPFDYVDSSTWVQATIFGRIENKRRVTREFSRTQQGKVYLTNYEQAMKMQDYYYKKWKKTCKD